MYTKEARRWLSLNKLYTVIFVKERENVLRMRKSVKNVLELVKILLRLTLAMGTKLLKLKLVKYVWAKEWNVTTSNALSALAKEYKRMLRN
jgi:hypothetical protein